jgi:hypothetical protein
LFSRGVRESMSTCCTEPIHNSQKSNCINDTIRRLNIETHPYQVVSYSTTGNVNISVLARPLDEFKVTNRHSKSIVPGAGQHKNVLLYSNQQILSLSRRLPVISDDRQQNIIDNFFLSTTFNFQGRRKKLVLNNYSTTTL